jgi:hypothetical protein
METHPGEFIAKATLAVQSGKTMTRGTMRNVMNMKDVTNTGDLYHQVS